MQVGKSRRSDDQYTAQTPQNHAYVGLDGAVVGVDRFGESAPMQDLLDELGLTVERVARAATAVARRRGRRRAPRHQGR